MVVLITGCHIITNMTTIISEVKLDYDDVLLLPKRSEVSSRGDVMLEREFTFKHCSDTITAIPIIAANMITVGTVSMARALAKYGMGCAVHKFAHPESIPLLPFVFVSTGIDLAFLERKDNPRYICVDVANGYNKKFAEFVSRVRDKFKDSCILAGNVVTGDMTYDLLERGADIVKIGIGSGAVCTTRKVTGVGYPQLSAIMECADAAHGVKGHICGDGGLVNPGDFAKGFGAGADFLMVGSMLAGTNESGTLRHYGMASDEAKSLYSISNEVGAQYSLAELLKHSRVAEGKSVNLPPKGPVSAVVEEILGGLRSACSYVGATCIKDLPKCTTFVKVNRQLNTSLNKYE